MEEKKFALSKMAYALIYLYEKNKREDIFISVCNMDYSSVAKFS